MQIMIKMTVTSLISGSKSMSDVNFNSVDKSFLFAFNFNNQTASVKCAFRLTCSKLLNGLRLLGLLGHVDTKPSSFENATFLICFQKVFRPY